MLDFLKISARPTKKGTVEIKPKFAVRKSSDLMIRGGDFYAIWVEERGLWSTDEQDVVTLVDRELDRYADENRSKFDAQMDIMYMWDADSGSIDRWHKYCQKQMRDNFHMLDEKLIFSNSEPNKLDYGSKRLPYPLESGDFSSYDKMMSVLYSEEERRKIEWSIGAIVHGDSRKIQKFIVLYGAPKTGKSTILNIIQQLFEGYWSVFDAKSLGSANSSFALEAFRDNPLVAIQHDGDLSRIEDNTRLNSLVSHESMLVNVKFKSAFSNSFKCFLYLGTNKPVKISDAKSGILRRLIDVSPTGERIPTREYNKLYKQIKFELGAIASHCLEVYEEDPNRYDNYIPLSMLGATNDFYNFVFDSYYIFKEEEMTTLTSAWAMYNEYCTDAKVPYPCSKRIFKEELKNYFKEFKERYTTSDGTRVRSAYIGFKVEKFEQRDAEDPVDEPEVEKPWLSMDQESSLFDEECKNCPAQYATNKGTPIEKWDKVKTYLSAIDTNKLHYVKIPENHIVIDFDIPDESGNKSFELNYKEAIKWPKTYAELSKSGEGIHLHYIYNGDATKLSRVYAPHIEIKVFNGNSSLRRKLTRCNDIPIATISSGLPVKGDKKMVNGNTIRSEKGLRTFIIRNLKKEIHPNTRPSINFIHDKLEEVYEGGLHYDVTDMKKDIIRVASESTNQAEACLKLVNDMKLKSKDQDAPVDSDKDYILFYDVEVFPNLFLVNWKFEGSDKPVMRMINPSPADIENLIKYRLIGFNCRRYDNHIMYARLMGYTNAQLYNLSQNIISGKKNAMLASAYDLSYTDVYDFSSKKQSLKKFEIDLGIHHQELGIPWDQPVPEDIWEKVAEYCDNDVIATEAVFNARQSDFTARKILADVADKNVNTPTNSLTTRIIFKNDRHPQPHFNYRNLGDASAIAQDFVIDKDNNLHPRVDDYTVFDKKGRPIFPGYKYEAGKSTYRGEVVGEGGYVYSEPGMYTDVALLDIASMHPSSIVAENLFGDEYTARFKEILDARIAIKHGDYEKAKTMLDGKLAKYLTDKNAAKDLAQALKIAINSVYGLTSAKFDNPFHDIRNKDNIVAKRGALFMINLKHAVQERGFTVAHIKTDSIKIPNATPEIIQFVMDYGAMYGYTFEHEATYEKMCLVNKAVYIAKNEGKWTATGDQFAVPYVFKTLFSHEPIVFDDLCETKQVKSAIFLDMNESLPDVTAQEKELAKLEKAYKKGDISEEEFLEQSSELKSDIDLGHNYIFVGRIGRFSPIKPELGGGRLVREQNGKYYAVEGSSGYRWLESEMVVDGAREDDVDMTYFNKLVDDAVETISEYGDFEWFIS